MIDIIEVEGKRKIERRKFKLILDGEKIIRKNVLKGIIESGGKVLGGERKIGMEKVIVIGDLSGVVWEGWRIEERKIINVWIDNVKKRIFLNLNVEKMIEIDMSNM